MSVTLWVFAALAVSTGVVPVPGVGFESVSWLTFGLEFIWVYAALVAATPLIGWLWARLRHPGALALLIAAAVLAIGAFIAFVSPGGSERGLFEWRKLMSAVSYLASFLVGGALGAAEGRSWEVRGARWPLALAIAVSLAVEGAAAGASDLRLLSALSFKSTSLLSFALAITALTAVAGEGSASAGKGTAGAGDGLVATGRGLCPDRVSTAVRWLTPSILGYYIAQSLLSGLWRPLFEARCRQALDLAGFPALLCAGVVMSLTMLALVLVVDRMVRPPLLSLLHLR